MCAFAKYTVDKKDFFDIFYSQYCMDIMIQLTGQFHIPE